MKPVDFRTAPYFSGIYIFLGIVFLILGVALVLDRPVWTVVLILTSLVIFTTQYRVYVDFEKRFFRDYLWIAGFKNGDKVRFERIEYIFVKKAKVSQTMRLRAASTTIRKEVYDGYLKFSEKDKVHLMTDDSKEVPLKKLTRIAAMLGTKIVDHADERP